MKPFYERDGITIYHGDARELAGEVGRVDCVVADPPYGETSLDWDRWPAGWPAALAPVSDCLWCFGSFRMFMEQGDQFGSWKLAQEIIWEKQNGTGFDADRFKRVHEMAVQFYRGKWKRLHHVTPKIQILGAKVKTATRRAAPQHRGEIGGATYTCGKERLQRSVIQAKNCHGHAIHPTQKPVAILTPLLRYSCPAGGIVLDPFMGSGSTLVAARSLGLRAIGIDTDEKWCRLAVERLEATEVE